MYRAFWDPKLLGSKLPYKLWLLGSVPWGPEDDSKKSKHVAQNSILCNKLLCFDRHFILCIYKINTAGWPKLNLYQRIALKQIAQLMCVNVLKGICLKPLIITVTCHTNIFWGVTAYNLSKSYSNFGRPCCFLYERKKLRKKEQFSQKIQCFFFKPSTVLMLWTTRTGLQPRGQGPEGPATGHLDTGFSWFPCVHELMLRWYPRCQVAITCFSCSPPRPKFNLVVNSVYM